MYIKNPPQESLDSWHKTNNKKMQEYLIQKLPVIHIKDGFYFFVKTEEWHEIMEFLPFYLKIIDFLEKKFSERR